MFCLRLGALWDRGKNRISIELDAAEKDARECSTLIVLPLYCALCRPAIFQTLFEGRSGFDDLEPGAYIFTVLAGNRTCVTQRVDVPDEPGKHIVIKTSAN